MSKKRSDRLIGTPVAEGVRFEIGETVACAVRNEQRDISVHVRRESHFFRNLFGRIPLLRGILRLFLSIGRFFSGLNLADDLHPQHPVRGSRFTRNFARLFRTRPQTLISIGSGLLIPVIFAACFFGLPELAEFALERIEDLPRFAVNAVCCIFRVAGSVLAVYLTTRLRVLNRLCMYRGAVSKVHNAYEAYGSNLTHEEVLLSSRLTDHSDGAFCMVVMMLSIVLFACFRTEDILMQLLFRICGILAVSAVTNELILPLERAKPESVGAALRKPLISLQHIFTIEPHNQMIEVAVCAFHAVHENHLP